MKLLHLADLHIGKIIYEQSLLEDQKYMLDEIIKIVKKEKIKAVLISGDIYDRSIPPADAVEVLNNFLSILIKEIKVKVLIISGNHDSKERLNFGSKIFENEGLYIQTEYNGRLRKIELEDKKEKANIYMLPFVKPIEVRKYYEEENIETYNDAIKLIMNTEEINQGEINILMAHQFVTTGDKMPETSDSETLNVGGLENVDVSCFDAFDYVALGHIHGPQRVGRDMVRYAGTMLKYSFSEVHHNKSVVIIEIKDNNISYKLKELKPLRDMREIKGPIEELINYENYKGYNTDDYIRAVITNENTVYDAIGQIRSVYPNTLSLEVNNGKDFIKNKELKQIEKIKEKTELELFEDFYKFQNNVDLEEEQKEILKDIIKKSKKEVEA